MGVAIYEEPEGAPLARDGEGAPESGISLPIWRHAASLIETYRAEPLRLMGETDALPESAPPIWRDASALRIELAGMEGAPETAGQDPAATYAPAPPIWRAVESWGPAGLQLASPDAGTERESSYMDAEPHNLSELASAPPIWNSFAQGAWPETYARHALEELEAAVPTEPPIWAPRIWQR